MPGGVIDEFLIKIGMEGDPSGLVDAYKQIFQLQDEYAQKQNETDSEENQADDKKQKRIDAMQKLQGGVNAAISKGTGLVKQGVGMARNWAVALLAVDGAAMAVIGRLSQMAVEYDNTAGSINMAASEMKAWEDTLKAAGGKADDVTGSLQQVYEKSFKAMMGEGDAGFQTAMAAFGVQTSEGGEMRNAGDIFADIIDGFRTALETGMDPDLARGYLEEAGISRQLAEPILRRDKEGGYIADQAAFEKFLSKSKSLDELADASSGLTQVITELSATFRDKFARVLTQLVESGVLEDMLEKMLAFVEGIDVEKVSDTIQLFIETMGRAINFLLGLIPGSEANIAAARGSRFAAVESGLRRGALLDALKESLGGGGYDVFQREAGRFGTNIGITEAEAVGKAQELGLDINQIFGAAGVPTVSNDIKIMIDGKNIPYIMEESQRTGNTDAAAMDTRFLY